MALFTPEEVRAVRIKGAKKIAIEGTTRSILVVNMVAARAFEMGELQKRVTEGDAKQADLYRALVAGACTDEAGNFFEKPEVDQLIEMLPLSLLVEVMQHATAGIGATPGNSKGSPVAG